MNEDYVNKHIPLSIQPRHIEVWKFIDSFIRANNYAPLIREVADNLKMHGSRVQVTVNELVSIGAIERFDRIKRGMRCIRFPVIPENMKRVSEKS